MKTKIIYILTNNNKFCFLGAQRDSTLDACASTIAEGKTLLDELKSSSTNPQNTVSHHHDCAILISQNFC